MCSYLCSTSFYCPNLIFIICNSQLFSMYKSSCRGNSGLNLCMHRLLDDNKIECCSYTKIREAISPPQHRTDLVDCAESSYVTQFFLSFFILEFRKYILLHFFFFSLSVLSSAVVMSLSVFLSVLSVLYVFLSFLITFDLFFCYSYSFLFSFLLSFSHFSPFLLFFLISILFSPSLFIHLYSDLSYCFQICYSLFSLFLSLSSFCFPLLLYFYSICSFSVILHFLCPLSIILFSF